jgi:hypothetical protein
MCKLEIWFALRRGNAGVPGGAGIMRLRLQYIAVCAGVALLASGCAMDLGGWGSDDSGPTASAPAPQPQQQVASTQYAPPPVPSQQQYPGVDVPPAGQAAFAPAPAPGDPTFSTSPVASGRTLGEPELRQLLTGKTITVADGRTLEYGRSGSYQESRNGQAIAVGQYRIRDESVCVQFTTGLSRCDSFVDNGGQLFVEDRNGQRLPAQAI